jgi:hypothetical protein
VLWTALGLGPALAIGMLAVNHALEPDPVQIKADLVSGIDEINR